MERDAEAREVSKSDQVLCPFTVFANWSKAGTNVRFEATADVHPFSEGRRNRSDDEQDGQ
jgi:hypothetical protein